MGVGEAVHLITFEVKFYFVKRIVKNIYFRHIHFISSRFKSVNNLTWNIFVAAISDPQQPGLAAILDFDILIEDSAVSISLLGFITLQDIYLDVDIAYIW